jgi:phage terminase large subunit-like protein
MPQRQALALLLSEAERRERENRLARYKPYAKQREFHNAGLEYRERLFMAGNQLGKTWSSAYEIAIHTTGRYPDWWRGKVWNRGVKGYAGSKSGLLVRDGMQKLLLGEPGSWGTGTIPGASIVNITRAAGVSDLVDAVTVRHESGDISRLLLKTYDQGRERWQADTVDFVAFDEEPPLDIYTEGLTRTNATRGIVWQTFTPLLGMSDVVLRFLEPHPDDKGALDRIVVNMTIRDAEHYSEAERERIIASYPAHEREARANGVPIMGEGRVFPFDERAIIIDPFEIPDFWPRIVGMDFGWDHPTAGSSIAWDRDNDRVFVTRTYRESKRTALQNVKGVFENGKLVAPGMDAILPWAQVPVAWPHDGLQHDKGAGGQLAEQYRKSGLNMLHGRAEYDEVPGEGRQTRFSVEAGIADMSIRMESDRLRVFSTCPQWFEEYRMYHRKDGKIVKLRDDLISSTRYGIMMLRYAQLPPRDIDKDKQGAFARRANNWRAG